MNFRESDDARDEYMKGLSIDVVKDDEGIWDQDKIFAYADRIAELQKWHRCRREFCPYQPGPVTLEVHSHNPCNERCTDCSGWRAKLGPSSSLDFEVFKWVIDEATALGVKGVQFSGGGEPWLHPHATDMAKYCVNSGLKIGIISNGTAFTDEDCRWLAENSTWIRLSLDAASREVRKLSHGVDFWDKVMHNAGRIIKHAHRDLVIGAGFLVSNLTISDAEKAVDLYDDMGFTYLQFRPYTHKGEAWFPEELWPIITKIVADSQGRRMRVVASGWKGTMDSPFYRTYDYCWGAHFRTEIAADRSVMPCCHLCAGPKTAFGKVEKPGDFTRIWHNKNMDHIDVRHCIPWCIYHSMNTKLQKFMKTQKHKEFLG